MKRRVGVAQFMALIAVLALVLAAMKVATEGVATAVILGSVIALLVAMLGAWVRRKKAAWVGFSLFGWGYIVILGFQAFAILFPAIDAFYWTRFRIDEPMAEFANWLHPELPGPSDPGIRCTFDPNGKPLLWNADGQNQRPLTSDEIKSLEVYQDQVVVRHERRRSASAACYIGLAFQGLAFALGGAFAGHLLGEKSRPAGTSLPARDRTRPADL